MPAKVTYVSINNDNDEITEYSEKEWNNALTQCKKNDQSIANFDNGTTKITNLYLDDEIVQKIEVK